MKAKLFTLNWGSDTDTMDVVVLGSANVDFICYVDRFPKPGETIHGRKFESGFGGKGANQCVAASRLGAKSAIIAKLGDDIWGKSYLENLQKQNIDVTFLDQCAGETTGIATISVNDIGENQIIIVAGANNLLSPNSVDQAETLLLNSKILICQLETPLEATIHALKKFRGISILNAAPAMVNTPRELLTESSILCINDTEAELMTGLKCSNVDESKLVLMKLLEMDANIVIITMGALGAVYVTKTDKNAIYVPVRKIENVIDTTGAGDSFIGALAYYLSNHPELPLHQQIGAACEAASFSVQYAGTQISFPTKDQITTVPGEYLWKVI